MAIPIVRSALSLGILQGSTSAAAGGIRLLHVQAAVVNVYSHQQIPSLHLRKTEWLRIFLPILWRSVAVKWSHGWWTRADIRTGISHEEVYGLAALQTLICTATSSIIAMAEQK